MKAVVLSIHGGCRTVEVDSMENSFKVVKRKGRGEFSEIFKYEKYNIVGFGWEDGKESFINKTELPPPFDNDFYYGDIILCMYDTEGKHTDFVVKQYRQFYNDIHGGFDDCDVDDDGYEKNTSEEDLDWEPGCDDYDSEDLISSEDEGYEEEKKEKDKDESFDEYTDESEETEYSWDFNQPDTDEEYIQSNP